MAAGLGVITPFCSCSAVPAFIGFVAAGVPIGVTLSFLIASPLVNEIAIGLLLGLFGWQVTAIYIGGRAGHRHRRRLGARPVAACERWVEPFVFETTLGGQVIDSTTGLTFDAASADGRRGGRDDPAQDLAVPARRASASARSSTAGRRRTSSPRYAGAGNAFGVLVAVRHRRPAVLQRRRHHAAGRGPARQGPADGHPAGLHDGRRRALPARDDPAAPRAQAPDCSPTFVAVVATGIVAVGYLFNALLA